jgi:hypothetical protein
MIAGALLQSAEVSGASTLPQVIILSWSQGLLLAGIGLGIWLVVESILKP